MAHANPNDAIYFNFDYFMILALKDATNRANALASVDSLRSTIMDLQVTSNLAPEISRIADSPPHIVKLLSHVARVFGIIISLIQGIGIVATLVIITIIVAVPLYLLSTALASFFAGNPALTVISVAVLGIGFVSTIRTLGQEKDILVAFRHQAQELSTAYDCVKFNDMNEFLLANRTPGGIDRCQKIDELHERARSGLTKILIDVVANRVDKIPGFDSERINQVILREYLRQALHKIKDEATLASE